jgi:hypothetical protein
LLALYYFNIGSSFELVRLFDMRNRRNSQPLSKNCMKFLWALRERGLEGKWPESQREGMPADA